MPGLSLEAGSVFWLPFCNSVQSRSQAVCFAKHEEDAQRIRRTAVNKQNPSLIEASQRIDKD